MWEYLFDFQQRQIMQDDLSLKEVTLLFYFSKKILCESVLARFQNFTYSKILHDLPILRIERVQLCRLILKLQNLGYIKIAKAYGSISIGLAHKYFNILSPRHSNEPEVVNYLQLLNCSWMNNSTINCSKMNNSNDNIYNSSNNIILNNINNNLDTKEDIINDSNNINKQKLLLPLFQKYKKFQTDMLDDLILPQNFDCQKLIDSIDKSYFLREKIGIKFLIDNYRKVLRGDYMGELVVHNKKDIGIQKAFCSRKYTEEELNSMFDDLEQINL